MATDKTMQFANFNITFGKSEEPMLTRFQEIIYPAFIGPYMRGKKDSFPQYLFNHVELKEVAEIGYVLAGYYIKNTELEVVTTYGDEQLIDSPSKVPTAPYSRFIIFLKNHRMILIKNEQSSPDIRSFQATVKTIIQQHTKFVNAQIEDKSMKLPFAIVNVVDIPLKEDIESVLRDAKKINWLNLRFFPLNNDMNRRPVAEAIKEEMKDLESDTANIKFNSPKSKEGVIDFLEESAGLAAPTLEITDFDGETKKIKEEAFSSKQKIPLGRNLQPSDDNAFIQMAIKNKIIHETSEDNEKLYNRLIDRIIQNLG